MNKKFRVGVIGRTGRGNYGHGLDVVWKQFPPSRVQVVAVADENEAGGRAAAERLAVRAVYRDYREMLRKEQPDLVSIAPRWVDPHHDMVLAAAEAHASIYLEKPMARTLAEADAMLAACERAHVKLAIAHQMRLAPDVLRAREMVAAGEIGELIEMRARGKEDRRAGGEDLMVLGTHAMDLMRLFAGDPLWTFAHVSQGGADLAAAHIRDGAEGLGPLAGDTITAMYSFPRGVHGFFGSNKNDDLSGVRFGVDLYGSRGLLTLRAGMDPDVHLFRSRSWAPARGAEWEKVAAPGYSRPPGDAFQVANERLAADLLEAIEKDTQPRSSGYDGRWALEMILSVYQSQRTGSRVRLPMAERRHPLTNYE